MSTCEDLSLELRRIEPSVFPEIETLDLGKNKSIIIIHVPGRMGTYTYESKPWNPIIANVFYRAGIIEKWGTGTLNIINHCKKNGNPMPTWEIRTQSVVTTFLPSIFFSAGNLPNESRPESLELNVLNLLEKESLSRGEIAKKLGHKKISGGLKKALLQLLARGAIAFTIPQKPNSRLQKYKIQKD